MILYLIRHGKDDESKANANKKIPHPRWMGD